MTGWRQRAKQEDEERAKQQENFLKDYWNRGSYWVVDERVLEHLYPLFIDDNHVRETPTFIVPLPLGVACEGGCKTEGTVQDREHYERVFGKEGSYGFENQLCLRCQRRLNIAKIEKRDSSAFSNMEKEILWKLEGVISALNTVMDLNLHLENNVALNKVAKIASDQPNAAYLLRAMLDFVVFEQKHGKAIGALELSPDYTHNNAEAKERDKKKAWVLDRVDLPLYVIKDVAGLELASKWLYGLVNKN